MRHPIDAEQLDAFVSFAEHMSFTAAARARRISQPALHTQVKKLSEALGVALYEKRGGKLSLTRDGERVLGFGRDARERARALVGELSGRDVRGPVVLCAGEGAYLYLLGEGLRRFTATRPRDLRLLVRDNEGTLGAVRTGEAHVGVASLDEAPAGVWARELTEVGQMLVLPADHALAAKESVRVADLGGEPLIVPPEGRPHRTMIAQAFRGAGVRLRVGVEATGWPLLVRFAELGMGAAIVNGFCRIPKGLVGRPMPELPSRTYHVVTREGPPKDGAVGSLVEALVWGADRWRKRA